MPDGAADLVTDLYRRRMPETRITDILLEVDDATRFTGAFTHLRTGSPCRDRSVCSTCCSPRASTSACARWPRPRPRTASGSWMRIARWHVEGDAFDRALAIVVEAQAVLPMAGFLAPRLAARLGAHQPDRRIPLATPAPRAARNP